MNSVADEGRLLCLHFLLEGATLRLFKNDFTPDGKTPLRKFDEVSSGGYERAEGLSWEIDEKSVTAACKHVWKFTGKVTACGWYMTRGRTLLGCRRFPDGPFDVRPGDRGVEVEATLSL